MVLEITLTLACFQLRSFFFKLSEVPLAMDLRAHIVC